ncbi:dephospho-CoA kinase [Rhizobium grahamii]|uniref:Dephospho-CoA kinase n=1 Tax=Rhizobium grahamii TaxID=1120045 RepID=A0A5Q0C7A6_9HYPH|nr:MULTISPECIES: dephospho-CoA kinase [Rhizobium]QFY61836.1 dephospho-CoA kinase [Rhizobium grahamii]QRM48988.1 dephospho-CoA kinase [Rhizobium sp. BG6]
MLRVGLTGSIGMGKSTMAKFFADAGVPVNDSDAVVHQLYAGEAAALVDAVFPGTMKNGAIDRQELSRQLSSDRDGFNKLESIIHPLVRNREQKFIEQEQAKGAEIVLLDIPLLFETGAEKRVDVVVVVSCDPQIQRQRVLARPNMTEEKFNMILSRQTPDAIKRERADYLIDTSGPLEASKQRVAEIVEDLKRRLRSGEFQNA